MENRHAELKMYQKKYKYIPSQINPYSMFFVLEKI